MADDGPLRRAQENLRITLADCDAFRDWTSTETATKALARIYHEGLPRPASGDVYTEAELNVYRPYAVVYTALENGLVFRANSVGPKGTEFIDGGSLRLRLVQTCPSGLNAAPDSESNELWTITVGRIIRDLCELAGQSDLKAYLAFHRLWIEFGPYFSDPSRVPDEGIWQGVEIGLDWGMAR